MGCELSDGLLASLFVAYCAPRDGWNMEHGTQSLETANHHRAVGVPSFFQEPCTFLKML